MELILEQLVRALTQLKSPGIPIEFDLWDADIISAYLKVSRRQVLEHYAVQPKFPQPINLPSGRPSGKTRKRHPRWKALEIITWAEKLQEHRRV